MTRLPLVSCLLLPALVRCEDAIPSNLRGAVSAGPFATNDSDTSATQLHAHEEVEDSDKGTEGKEDSDENMDMDLNGTELMPSLQAKTCYTTHRADQCLMARAMEADKPWGPWTRYVNNDRDLTGPQSLKTDCSGFVTWALTGCNLGAKVLQDIGRSGPNQRTRARNFYDAFGPSPLGSKKWCRVADFRDVQRGDVLAYDIPDNGPGKDSGHIMIAYRSPFEVGRTHDGKLVFAQKVIDSSYKPHFDFGTFKETRRSCPSDKKCGAGVGYIYVFTDSRGRVSAMRLRGDPEDRNAKNCYATDSAGKKKKIGCYSQSNHERHRYRIGRLRR